MIDGMYVKNVACCGMCYVKLHVLIMLKFLAVLSLKRRIKEKEKETLPPKAASQFPNSQCENMKERSLLLYKFYFASLK